MYAHGINCTCKINYLRSSANHFWLVFDGTQTCVLIWIFTTDLFLRKLPRILHVRGIRQPPYLDFVTFGLIVVLCSTSRTFRLNPHHNKGYFGLWTFRPKSTRTQFKTLRTHCSLFEPNDRTFVASLWRLIYFNI